MSTWAIVDKPNYSGYKEENERYSQTGDCGDENDGDEGSAHGSNCEKDGGRGDIADVE